MQTAFIVFMWTGAIGTSTVYWFRFSGTDEQFLWRRVKTSLVFCFWYVFLIGLVVAHRSGRTIGNSNQPDSR